MRRPVFSFEAELLTDAPFEHIARRLQNETPGAFECLRSLRGWTAPEEAHDGLLLRWERILPGAVESGVLTISPDPRGAHLHLEGRMKGWGGFLFFGILRWRTDRLLDRFVEEL
ncbi:MAG: hypothetical protein LWW79_03685 [Holophagaceae bacterium]|nr:hypothetical protein [Holophagaceae bacterium]